jgi:dipeptidase
MNHRNTHGIPSRRWIVASFLVSATAGQVSACTAIIVGKAASKDGSVLVGHNDDYGGTHCLNFRAVPRLRHPPQATVEVAEGLEMPEVPETWAYLWSQLPGLPYSDIYLNEWGVAVLNNYTPSRDTEEAAARRGELLQGGVQFMLKRLIAQRAKSAREGLAVAKDLIERFGYGGGWTTVIADGQEAWLLSLAPGKHWVAQRVPDDAVVILPNTYIISEVDPNDPTQFMAAADLIQHACAQGWYDPNGGVPFSFRDAYATGRVGAIDGRQRRGQGMMTGREIESSGIPQLPFAVRPKDKIGLAEVMAFLRDRGPGYSICNDMTQESSIFQLRSSLPPAVGCVYWHCLARPDVSVFVPWYAGIQNVPDCYHKSIALETQLSLSYHLSPPGGTFDVDPNHAWWDFKALAASLLAEEPQRRETARAILDAFEDRELDNQPAAEAKAVELHAVDPQAARAYLTDYCSQWGQKARRLAEGLPHRLRRPERPIP